MMPLEEVDKHNARLLAEVHPPDWTNPQAQPLYNLVVIGAGTAGLVCAAAAAGLGAKVALVERDLLGGDCLNFGCVPSKGLLRAAKSIAQVRKANQFGIHVPEGVTVDFAAVMERVRRVRADISRHDSAQRFRTLGVDVFFGVGKFTGPATVEVAGQTLPFRKAVIATGTRATHLPIPGLAEAGFLTNETIFSLTKLPARFAVIGAGPVGCELAQAFARLGSQVVLLDIQKQILPREDSTAAERVERALRQDGIRLVLGTSISHISKTSKGKTIFLANEDSTEIIADDILLATGRQPNIEGLNLPVAGVQFDPQRGVEVDDFLCTGNRRIYAAGDICTRYQFTHAADALARLVVRNALFLGRARASALTIPWCTFTDPEIARVGLSEQEARAQGIPYDVFTQELHEVDRAILDGESDGFVKVLVHKGGDRILGATVVAADAGSLIAELTMAVTAKIGLGAIASIIHPYPIQAEAIKKIGDSYQRTRLTPLVQFLFRKWLAWSR